MQGSGQRSGQGSGPPHRAGPATGAAALKDAIDRGGTADKVPGFDPGAAALGTDEESGGAGLAGARAPAARSRPAGQGATGQLAADPAGTDRSAYRRQDRAIGPAIVAVLVVLVIAVVAVLWARA